MPVTDSTLRVYEVSLGGPVVAELDVVAKYHHWTLNAGQRVAVRCGVVLARTNGATPVVVLPAPADADHENELTELGIVQVNAADTEVLFKYNDNGTRYLDVDFTLSQGDNLRYE